jgi:hypothetical protein
LLLVAGREDSLAFPVLRVNLPRKSRTSVQAEPGTVDYGALREMLRHKESPL